MYLLGENATFKHIKVFQNDVYGFTLYFTYYKGLGVKAIRAVMDESHKIFKCNHKKIYTANFDLL